MSVDPGPARPARVIAAAIFVATIVGCGLSLTIALLAVRLDQAGYSARAIGLNTAAGGVATLIASPWIRPPRAGSASHACWSPRCCSVAPRSPASP